MASLMPSPSMVEVPVLVGLGAVGFITVDPLVYSSIGVWLVCISSECTSIANGFVALPKPLYRVVLFVKNDDKSYPFRTVLKSCETLSSQYEKAAYKKEAELKGKSPALLTTRFKDNILYRYLRD